MKMKEDEEMGQNVRKLWMRNDKHTSIFSLYTYFNLSQLISFDIQSNS